MYKIDVWHKWPFYVTIYKDDVPIKCYTLPDVRPGYDYHKVLMLNRNRKYMKVIRSFVNKCNLENLYLCVN